MSIRVVDRVHVSSKDTSPATSHYFPNRTPLQPCPFQKLPPGAIQPNGWLLSQLKLQLNGLNGRMSEISDYLVYEQCGWVDPSKGAWEELPYWLRGFVDLAFVTGDQNALDLTHRWIDGILSSQQSDGWFGPNGLRTSLDGVPDFWPAMLLMNVFRSFYEYSNDARVLPFLLKYFQFVNTQSIAVFQRGWGFTRWADNIDTIIWLFNRTSNTDWLLDLVHKIHAKSANWVTSIPTWHNVNISQGFREPALYSMTVNPADPSLIQATYNVYQTVMNQYGQFPGGGFAGDENCRSGFGDPRQGFETCGIVELMHSFSVLTRVTGDGIWADRCETLAINALPAALDPFLARGTHYISCANCIQLDNQAKTQGQFNNGFAMLAFMPGIHNYRCCPHNYGMGWPYYTEELWLATYDGGLCASMYASCQVKALVGPNTGTEVVVFETTDYPFGDTVQFRFSMPQSTQFPFYLRVPRWVQKRITVTLNGEMIFDQETPKGGSFIIFDRLWNDGDVLSFSLPMTMRTQTWMSNRNSLSLAYGPLSFSLAIDEQWNRISGTDEWPEFEVLPKSNWNYGLVMTKTQEWCLKRKKTKDGNVNPFTRATTPIELTVQARRIPTWVADSENVVGLLPQSPVASTEPDETVTLVPMGAARLRITAFPQIAQ